MSGARSRSAAMPPKHSSNTAGQKRSKPSHVQSAATAEATLSTTEAQSDIPSPPEPVFFWKPDDPENGYLSQWYTAPFSDPSDPSVVFPTAEHYMTYHQALLFDPPSGPAILEATTPNEVRALGHQVAHYDESVWNANKMRIVTDGNRLKFTHGPEAARLRDLLLATADRELVEADPTDRVWGIGFNQAKAGASDRKNWGKNLLGKALATVRGELLAEEAKSRIEAEDTEPSE
ncbi:hypothetical protein ACHAQA_003181 [Verticillium albo-atrum]